MTIRYTSDHGLPYPEGSDSVAPATRDFRGLAIATDAAITTAAGAASTHARTGKALTSGHLDSLTTPGLYRIASSTIATAMGGPEASSMDVEVVNVSTDAGTIPVQTAIAHWSSGNYGSPAGMRLYVRRRSTSGWSPWGQPFGPGDNTVRFMRLLAETDHLDNLTTPGIYGIPGTPVATAVGAPEIGAQTVMVIPLGSSLTAQVVHTGSVHNANSPRTWYRIKATAWTGWTGPQGNMPGTPDLLHFQDRPGQTGHIVKLNHYGNGSGQEQGQTYGIDISNWPGARQAIVVHQYSNAREAVRIDNTDTDAGIYINNTQNLNRNPGRNGQGAPFLKFHPYNMGNFLDYAYLMDDLGFVNDTTQTWSFKAKNGPIVQFKNAAGAVVAQVDQGGTWTGKQQDTGRRNITGALTATPTAGTASLNRVGNLVMLSLDGITLAANGSGNLAVLPLGFRPPPGETVSTTGQGISSRLQVTSPGNVQVYNWAAGAPIFATLTWITRDAWPTTLPGTPA
ncbi:MAG: pyocin knob domain-containing protein [Propionibacteriaceae bacterium]|nr:pyocin knob domain-containing protein [Propionibacteriaceae bacterium]